VGKRVMPMRLSIDLHQQLCWFAGVSAGVAGVTPENTVTRRRTTKKYNERDRKKEEMSDGSDHLLIFTARLANRSHCETHPDAGIGQT
jgi:hypothetical protein